VTPAALWQRLTGPARSAEGRWGRQNRLLAALLLLMIGLGGFSAAVLILLRSGEAASVPVALGAAGLLLLAFRLNQTGRYGAAAGLAVGICSLAVWGLLLLEPANVRQDSLSLAYLAVPVLVAGLLLPVGPTLAVIGGGLLVLWRLAPAAPAALAPNTLIYLAVTSGLTLVSGAVRERQLSEMERGNRELAESVAQFQNAFEHTSTGMALVALDGRWLRVNSTLCHIVGYTEAELQRIDFQRMTHPDDLVDDLAQVRRVLAGEFNSYQIDKRYFHRQGHQVWVTLNVSLLRAADGTPLHFITQVQDISARKQAEEALRTSEARFRTLSHSSPVGIFQTDAAGRAIYHNARWYAITGLNPAAAGGRDWLEAVHPDDRPRLAAEWAHALQSQASFTGTFRLAAPAGPERWAQARATPILAGDTGMAGYVGTVADISDQMASEAALQAANARMAEWVSELETHSQEIGLLNELSNLLQSCLTAQEAYGILSQLGVQLFPRQAGLLGITNASRNLVETVVVWGQPDGQRLGAPVFSPEDCWALRRGRMHWYEAGSGAVRCAHLGQAAPETYVCLPMMAHGETLGVLHLQAATPGTPALSLARRSFGQTVADSVSLALANLKLRERLRDQSIRDALTGLFNRRYLEETLDRELRRAEREGQPVGVLMLDIDHFKRFNDSFGHGAGDEVLRALGQLLMRHVRVEDIACRYGGEEFTVVLPGCSLDTAIARAEALREQARDLQVHHAGQALGGITVSAGVAAFPQHGTTESAVLRAADGALYQAKQAGRNRVVVSSGAAEP
jgi:diguanylate cyclase (GGDEF)-like protein/PAS domain S-box-containing protein